MKVWVESPHRSSRCRLPVAAASVVAGLGCGDVLADRDGRVFGDDLGTFHVVAEREQTTCGDGAVGAPSHWEFDVRLSREERTLYWNTGAAAVEGTVDADGVSFSISSQTRVEIAPPEPEIFAGCVVMREDEATGALDAPGLEVGGFEATLSYAFAPEGDSDCQMLVGVPGGFSELPCEMAYTASASRAEK